MATSNTTYSFASASPEELAARQQQLALLGQQIPFMQGLQGLWGQGAYGPALQGQVGMLGQTAPVVNAWNQNLLDSGMLGGMNSLLGMQQGALQGIGQPTAQDMAGNNMLAQLAQQAAGGGLGNLSPQALAQIQQIQAGMQTQGLNTLQSAQDQMFQGFRENTAARGLRRTDSLAQAALAQPMAELTRQQGNLAAGIQQFGGQTALGMMQQGPQQAAQMEQFRQGLARAAEQNRMLMAQGAGQAATTRGQLFGQGVAQGTQGAQGFGQLQEGLFNQGIQGLSGGLNLAQGFGSAANPLTGLRGGATSSSSTQPITWPQTLSTGASLLGGLGGLFQGLGGLKSVW